MCSAECDYQRRPGSGRAMALADLRPREELLRRVHATRYGFLLLSFFFFFSFLFLFFFFFLSVAIRYFVL
jgi:hypothetical protein